MTNSAMQNMLPRLKSLRLSGILDTVDVRNSQAVEQKLSYVEFLDLVLVDETDRRENKKLEQRLRRANFPSERYLESFNFDAPGLRVNRNQVYDLATCLFVEERNNVLIVGPTGTGKSHLAQAIGHRACIRGFDVLFDSFKKTMSRLRAARGDGTYSRKLQVLARPDLLILDDFGLTPLTSPADEDFHELVCERAERVSTLITSNLDFSEWHIPFPNSLLGAATVDRLRYGAHRVVIDGSSHRRPRPIPELDSGVAPAKTTAEITGGTKTKRSNR